MIRNVHSSDTVPLLVAGLPSETNGRKVGTEISSS